MLGLGQKSFMYSMELLVIYNIYAVITFIKRCNGTKSIGEPYTIRTACIRRVTHAMYTTSEMCEIVRCCAIIVTAFPFMKIAEKNR